MNDRLELLDYYTLLGVDGGASVPQIKAAFRQFARRYHPDRFAGAPESKRERAEQIYRRGSEAFQILTDATSRRAYDRVLRAGKMRLTTEERDRAQAETRKVPAAPQAPIRSANALAFYRKAADLARAQKWREAWRALRTALEHEPGNPLLEQRLRQIEARIRIQR